MTPDSTHQFNSSIHQPNSPSHQPNSPIHQLTNSPILIVGSGITGLTAAYALHRLGLRPRVLEAAPRSGGLIYSERVDGFTIEAGPDSVLSVKPAALELIDQLGLSARVQHVRPPGGAYVLRGRRLYRLPRPSLLGIPLTWRGLARYDLLPWHARVRLALEPTVPRRRSEADESVASFFRRRFGPDTVDLIAQPLLGGIHAGDIEQLSMASLFPRLRDLERTRGRVLGVGPGSDLGRTRDWPEPYPGHAAGTSPFMSLTGGMGTLVDALEHTLPPGTIDYGARVERLTRTADGWRLDVHSDAGPRTETARAVIFACPARVVSTLVSAVDREAADLCARVPYVSTASVALAWPRSAVAHPLSGTGFVVARSRTDVRVTACTWVSSKWDGRAPDEAVLVRVFIGGAHDPAAPSLGDAELVAIVRRDLDRVLGIGAEPMLARVHRWLDAGAQHTVGHLDRTDRVERRLSAAGGLFAAGSGFRSVGIPDCIADARRAATEAADYLRQLS
ncbi:MAG: protoporphyrinogen oxidase [Vicinamibacterales bacterium]